MKITKTVMAAAAMSACLVVLSACGGESDTEKAEKAVDTALGGESKAELKGRSPLDAAAYALVRVQSAKFEDYELAGTTVRLLVRDGVQLAGSECAIIQAATGVDHPEASFVVVEKDGTETPC